MRAKRKFKLRSLLLAVAVVAIAVHWCSAGARVARSRSVYSRVLGSCYDGSLTSAELQTASRRLLRDELNVPFVNRRRAIVEYLDRLCTSILVQRKKLAYAYTDECEEEHERLRCLIDERDKLLGLRRPGRRSIPAIARNTAD